MEGVERECHCFRILEHSSVRLNWIFSEFEFLDGLWMKERWLVTHALNTSSKELELLLCDHYVNVAPGSLRTRV
jgi:hypothetical protein